MNDKKVVLTIKHNSKLVSGILTTEMLALVCAQTGLSEEEVISNINWLSELGIIGREEATVH